MKTVRKIGYARVSTGDQELALQLDALKGAGCRKVFQDQGVSGASVKRPGLDEALSSLKKGDVLVVWKLDRLGRSLAHLIEVVSGLARLGIGFQSLSDGIDTTTAAGKLMFHVIGALAEFERSLIAERTKAGMKAAKRRGRHVGRPVKLSAHQLAHARKMIERGEETRAGAAALLGVDVATLRRRLAVSR